MTFLKACECLANGDLKTHLQKQKIKLFELFINCLSAATDSAHMYTVIYRVGLYLQRSIFRSFLSLFPPPRTNRAIVHRWSIFGMFEHPHMTRSGRPVWLFAFTTTRALSEIIIHCHAYKFGSSVTAEGSWVFPVLAYTTWAALTTWDDCVVRKNPTHDSGGSVQFHTSNQLQAFFFDKTLYSKSLCLWAVNVTVCKN